MQRDDYKWFLKNYDKLYNTYGLCYVVIKDKKVLGTYPTYADGVKKTNAKLGTFIVQLCNGKSDGYTNSIVSMNFAKV